jgi:hypothetical protein
MNIRVYIARAMLLAPITAMVACVTRPPTIAHVHIGHALTGVHITPDHKGYILVAEQRADETLLAVKNAAGATDLPVLKSQIAVAVSANDDQDNFGVKQSLIMAANHISFAATSSDASENVIRFAPVFKSDIAAVIGRCDYIDLLAKDVAASASMADANLLVQEILKAAQANVDGDDSKQSGSKGSAPAEYGMVQLRAELQAMIARENPAYRTVDNWYLFNLVRLPSGRWVFDKLSRGGTIDGYK